MKLFATVFAFLLVLSGTAFANGKAYVEGTVAHSDSGDLDVGGYGFPTDSTYMIGLAIGGLLANAVSVEGELTYSKRDIGNYNESLATMAIMANVYYNFQIANMIGGYAGVGIGGARQDLDWSGGSDDKFVAAYQVLLGVTWAVNNIILFSEYRYQASQDADFGGTDVEYNSHNVGVGIRIPLN